MQIEFSTIAECSSSLYWKALRVLPGDVKRRLKEAREGETDANARSVLDSMIQNAEMAEEKKELICQDTGFPVFFVDVGPGCVLDFDLDEAVAEGVAWATRDHSLRANCVDVLTRDNTGDNRGRGYPMVHARFGAGDEGIKMTLLAKGSGSESRSRLAMLDPVKGWEGMERFILETVASGGAKSCPPVVVGVGIGGSFDSVAVLSKRALTRPLGSNNPDPELAGLEARLLERINGLGIGPMGLGGDSSALWVSLESEDTHITCSPIAVNMSCWAHRRATAAVDDTGFEVMD